MPNKICRNLRNAEKENELKKHSIYLLGEDKEDRGFEFFVFIEPEDVKNRSPFLIELHNLIINGHETKNFFVSSHKNELKKWLGLNSDNDEILTPFDWLKIAIERYPYRLFIVIDEKKWSKNDKSPLNDMPIHNFLKRRICFIYKDTFFKQISNDPKFNDFRYWLYEKWIMHLCNNLDVKGELKLKINLETFSGEDYYIPSSLYIDRDRYQSEKKRTEDLDLKIDMSDLKNLILYRRHDLIYTYEEKWTCNKNLYEEDNPDSRNIYYIEAGSGSLSYFSELQSPTEIGKLKLIENGLLRILIIDERLQEWANELSINPDKKYISNLYQMKLLVGFFEKASLYGQKNNKQPYEAILDKNGNFILKGGMTTNHKLKCGIDSDLKIDSIDILIIHQGILDNWFNEKKVDLTHLIFNWKEKIPFIIVTSGRGKPENIPRNVKFLPFSNTEMCMSGQYFEKLTLIKQLFNLKEDIL